MTSEIPPLTVEMLNRWVSYGIPPGHFLTAVLCNDLRTAVMRADDANARALPDIVKWIFNHAPEACWGSPQAVNRWRFSKRRPIQQPQEIKG
jgi:hypothetical protein